MEAECSRRIAKTRLFNGLLCPYFVFTDDFGYGGMPIFDSYISGALPAECQIGICSILQQAFSYLPMPGLRS